MGSFIIWAWIFCRMRGCSAKISKDIGNTYMNAMHDTNHRIFLPWVPRM